MSERVTVARLPDCDFCKRTGISVPARYDAKTYAGPWANMCEGHFLIFGVGLGTGLGQELVTMGADRS